MLTPAASDAAAPAHPSPVEKGDVHISLGKVNGEATSAINKATPGETNSHNHARQQHQHQQQPSTRLSQHGLLCFLFGDLLERDFIIGTLGWVFCLYNYPTTLAKCLCAIFYAPVVITICLRAATAVIIWYRGLPMETLDEIDETN